MKKLKRCTNYTLRIEYNKDLGYEVLHNGSFLGFSVSSGKPSISEFYTDVARECIGDYLEASNCCRHRYDIEVNNGIYKLITYH